MSATFWSPKFDHKIFSLGHVFDLVRSDIFRSVISQFSFDIRCQDPVFLAIRARLCIFLFGGPRYCIFTDASFELLHFPQDFGRLRVTGEVGGSMFAAIWHICDERLRFRVSFAICRSNVGSGRLLFRTVGAWMPLRFPIRCGLFYLLPVVGRQQVPRGEGPAEPVCFREVRAAPRASDQDQRMARRVGIPEGDPLRWYRWVVRGAFVPKSGPPHWQS